MPATPRTLTLQDVEPMDLGPDALPVYSIEDMGKLPPPRWFVRNFLEDKGMTLVFGREKTGKSTAVLNILMSWLTKAEDGAFGDDHRFKYEEDPTDHSVLYLLLEGQNTVYYRAKAWADANGAGLPENLHIMGHSLSLFNKNVAVESRRTWTPDMFRLWTTIDKLRPTVVVIDTFSRANPNLPENSPEVASFVGFLDLIRDEFDVSFIIVHHAPKALGVIEPRGHSSLAGAATTLVYFKRNDTEDATKGLTMWVGRQRNGMDLGDLPYDLVFESAEYGASERPIEVAYLSTSEKKTAGGQQQVMELIGDHEVTVAALKKALNTRAVYQWVDELEDAGKIEVVIDKPKTVRRVNNGE